MKIKFFQLRKRAFVFTLIILCSLLLLAGCSKVKLQEGSEQTYYGTVTDRAISDDIPYISIKTEAGEEYLFHFTKDTICPGDVTIGYAVKVDSMKEQNSDRLIAINIKKV